MLTVVKFQRIDAFLGSEQPDFSLVQGDTTTAISFRDDANNMHALTPAQVVELWEKAAGYISAVYAASWTLKDGTIPADYADDRHWP